MEPMARKGGTMGSNPMDVVSKEEETHDHGTICIRTDTIQKEETHHRPKHNPEEKERGATHPHKRQTSPTTRSQTTKKDSKRKIAR